MSQIQGGPTNSLSKVTWGETRFSAPIPPFTMIDGEGGRGKPSTYWHSGKREGREKEGEREDIGGGDRFLSLLRKSSSFSIISLKIIFLDFGSSTNSVRDMKTVFRCLE